MASTVPDSVTSLQIALREEAGVSSYDPNDPKLLNFPSLGEIIEGFDPSPPYLRCKNCRGKLMRGIQSFACVYCGAQQQKEIPPDPIPFKSTVAYRWLLESLDLNGSEAVGLENEDGDLTKGKKASSDQLVLSDLFDLEWRWSAGVGELENKNDRKESFKSNSLNLAGVDLDNFFFEAPKEITGVHKEQSIASKDIKRVESHDFSDQESLSLFGSAQSSNVEVRPGPIEGAVGDSFSGWEAEFQTASSGAISGKSNFNDPFMLPPVECASPVESVISLDTGNNSKTIKEQAPNETSNKFPSTSNSWMEDDLWPAGNTNTSNREKINEDDSMDIWQDFSSSGNAQDALSGSWKQTNDRNAPQNEASEVNMMGFNNDVQEMDFGSFMQPDHISGASGNNNFPIDSSIVQETSISNSVANAEVKSGDNAKTAANGDESSVQPDSTDAVVESLMSQMPDLSFMLESKLSIPEKKDGFDSTL